MNLWYAAAAILSATTCGLHIIFGGREAAQPLLASTEIDLLTKFTNYYCWHLVTIMIGALAVAYGYAAWMITSADLGLFATGITFLFALWSVAMIIHFRLPALKFQQWALFAPIGILGLIGSVA